MKKNVTVVLEATLARWLRVEAARRDTSISQYLSELVEREREREEGYADAMTRYLARTPQQLGRVGEALPARSELHER
jgi:hypothetical protein